MKMSTEKGPYQKMMAWKKCMFSRLQTCFFSFYWGIGIYVKFLGLCAISNWWDFGIIKYTLVVLTVELGSQASHFLWYNMGHEI